MTKHEKKIIERAERFIEGSAYWVAPDGEIYYVSTRHTDFILTHPKLFGLTVEEVNNYREDLDKQSKIENKDLESQMVRKGWIRMRQYTTRNNQGWTIEVYKIDSPTINNLFDFVTTVYEYKKIQTGTYPKFIDVYDYSSAKVISVYRYEQSNDWNQSIVYKTDFNDIIQGIGPLFENISNLKYIMNYNSFKLRS